MSLVNTEYTARAETVQRPWWLLHFDPRDGDFPVGPFATARAARRHRRRCTDGCKTAYALTQSKTQHPPVLLTTVQNPDSHQERA